jgi:hypothetical protein
MPDISMCSTTDCPLATTCYRSQESGTVPTPERQAWMSFVPIETSVDDVLGVQCDGYWPTRKLRRKP